MTQSSCATLGRKMGGNEGRNLAAQRSKQLFWNQESVPQVSTLPEFNRMEGTGVFLLLQLQTAFVWACWVWFCQGMWSTLKVQGNLQACLPALVTWSYCPPTASFPLDLVSPEMWVQAEHWIVTFGVVYCTESSPCKSKVQKWPPGLGISW